MCGDPISVMASLVPDEPNDADTVLDLLRFCQVPRLQDQIMDHCRMDENLSRRFCEHCISKGMLRVLPQYYGPDSFVITPRGSEVLATAEEINRTLGIA
jgi:hypothetical protein